ncbi:uncharacterized protein TNIN_173971 [Trichonephila inaurata madagascariensis]|uniref:Uncharacterized protein n=1 Tax=Trichonephila inaurata madagascariensis TaxID=2747483 RepID=A0A8X6YSK4_9ARAC|nr:uncharacterized protein TNIN_173971 [Trichonephila inaurata madagascariensis]
MLKLDLGLRRQFTWSFIIANVSKAITGADFLKKFGLLVDLKRKCLIDPLTSLSSFGKIVTIPNFSLTTIVSSGYDSSIAKLLSEFKEITFNNSFIKEPKHLVTHHIVTSGPPVSAKDAGLVIKIAKCQFLQTEVDFLGHHISVNGIEPSKERIKVIEDFKLPETVKDLRRYLGVINFYHRFIPNAAENQAVLNYLKGKKTTPAELLYGESIRLPCDFFEDTLFRPQSEFVQTLKATVKDFKPIPFSYHSKQKPFFFKDLKDCSHVFVHTNSVRRSLQPPYHRPYKVINRSDKVFTLFINSKNVNVSIDRLKPCFSDNSSETDIESSIGEDAPNKPAKMPEKKIRFDF